MNPIIKKTLLVIFVPLFFAFISYLFFTNKQLQEMLMVMTLGFLFGVPFVIGVLTIFFSDVEHVKSWAYRICMPWLPIIIFFLFTFLFNIEGLACWFMALPLFLIASSLGGLTAGYYKLKKHKNENTYVSLLVLLPFFVTPIEQMIAKIPGRYKADTYIDIRAGKDKIWSNVTRVREINAVQDKGWLSRTMGFPRPIKAELDFEGKGGFRKAIFDKGLVFDETVTAYEHQRMMRFTIKATPYDIPSTTMDKHIVIGGDFFDVLNGTYELEQLNVTTYRLHLYSHFKLTTTFNFYASWWAGWIMKDIQNNILQVIKQRAEENNPQTAQL